MYQLVGMPAVSPNGRSIAALVNEDGNNGDIWVFDLERGTRQRLTFDPAWEIAPAWSPDGKLVYYSSTADGTIRSRHADGTGGETVLHRGYDVDLARDGRWMTFDLDNSANASTDIGVVAMPGDSTKEARMLIATRAEEQGARIAPSGAYLAYNSDESGRHEVYLTRFPSGEGKWQVSVNGGSRARWDPAGGQLYFTSEDAVLAVDVTETPDLRLGNPRTLFLIDDAHVRLGRTSALSPDRGGKRFVMSYNAAGDTQLSRIDFVLVESWTAEFKKNGK
jgi:Tol biopolymer transport system component